MCIPEFLDALPEVKKVPVAPAVFWALNQFKVNSHLMNVTAVDCQQCLHVSASNCLLGCHHEVILMVEHWLPPMISRNVCAPAMSTVPKNDLRSHICVCVMAWHMSMCLLELVQAIRFSMH